MLEEGLNKRVKLMTVKERDRTFFLIKAKDKKSCIDGFNRIMETKRIFEQLPGTTKFSHFLREIRLTVFSF